MTTRDELRRDSAALGARLCGATLPQRDGAGAIPEMADLGDEPTFGALLNCPGGRSPIAWSRSSPGFPMRLGRNCWAVRWIRWRGHERLALPSHGAEPFAVAVGQRAASPVFWSGTRAGKSTARSILDIGEQQW